MPHFHETVLGRRFFEGQLPQFLNHLETIATELKRANDLKESHNDVNTELKRLVNEIAEVEPKLAQILDEYLK
ncbi:hypothetical protein [Cytobacillus praedii]|uniref:hypothetical protein n=1 Tax=Cytobacillus praedii TaxID=1742358 RepID=UPI002E1ED88B|nr:hypothetical protein [Cytobacillus praedii]